MSLFKKEFLFIIIVCFLIQNSGTVKTKANVSITRDNELTSCEKINKNITVIVLSSNKKALDTAKRYISLLPLSKKGLIKQLKFEGFTDKEVEYAVKNLKVNWKEQAIKKDKDYLDTMAFSKKGLIKQLKYEGFTDKEAEYAVKNLKVSWNEQAIKKAKDYLDTMAFSKKELIRQLIFEGFTQKQAEYGASKAIKK